MAHEFAGCSVAGTENIGQFIGTAKALKTALGQIPDSARDMVKRLEEDAVSESIWGCLAYYADQITASVSALEELTAAVTSTYQVLKEAVGSGVAIPGLLEFFKDWKETLNRGYDDVYSFADCTAAADLSVTAEAQNKLIQEIRQDVQDASSFLEEIELDGALIDMLIDVSEALGNAIDALTDFSSEFHDEYAELAEVVAAGRHVPGLPEFWQDFSF